MNFQFDLWGWLTESGFPTRITDIEPPTVSGGPVVGAPWPNFTGHGWVLLEYKEPIPEPPLPEANPVARRITRLAFRNRFTQAELITLEIAGLDDPTAPMAQRQQAAAIRVMQRQVSDATFIDLDRPDTRAGVQQLEAGGIIGVGRDLEILDAAIDPTEMYYG